MSANKFRPLPAYCLVGHDNRRYPYHRHAPHRHAKSRLNAPLVEAPLNPRRNATRYSNHRPSPFVLFLNRYYIVSPRLYAENIAPLDHPPRPRDNPPARAAKYFRLTGQIFDSIPLSRQISTRPSSFDECLQVGDGYIGSHMFIEGSLVILDCCLLSIEPLSRIRVSFVRRPHLKLPFRRY